jgi:hypothetical protein
MSNLDFIIRLTTIFPFVVIGLPLIAMFVRIFWIIGTDVGIKALRIRNAKSENKTAPDSKVGNTSLKTNKYN